MSMDEFPFDAPGPKLVVHDPPFPSDDGSWFGVAVFTDGANDCVSYAVTADGENILIATDSADGAHTVCVTVPVGAFALMGQTCFRLVTKLKANAN